MFINSDDKTYVEPDISVICDKNKLDDRGCNGAPDWVIEDAAPALYQFSLEIPVAIYSGFQISIAELLK